MSAAHNDVDSDPHGQVSRRRLPGRRLSGPRYPIASAVFGAAIIALVTWLFVSHPESTPSLPDPPAKSDPAAQAPVPRADVQRASFYDLEVEPLIAATDSLNREASKRCVKRLERVFAGYHAGVQPFVEDLTSISTRFGIVRRMPGNWWRKDNRVQNYVQAKFEAHLFSEQKLLDDVTAVLNGFRDEVDVNQKRMLIGVRAALNTSDLPDVNVEEYEPFFAAVAQQLQGYAAKQGTTSVMNALGVFIISEAGVFTARSVIAGLLARFGTAAAVGAAAGGGATAGGAAAGAGGGTLAGPVGTAVGFGVGLAVGLVIDWWMTEKFEARMSQQMNQYIASLRTTILHGGFKVDPSRPQLPPSHQPGITESLPVVCDRLTDAYRERFYQQIVTRGSSL